jgi:hypothetical protein
LRGLIVDGKIILKWMLRKQRMRVGNNSFGGPVAAYCEHGTEIHVP